MFRNSFTVTPRRMSPDFPPRWPEMSFVERMAMVALLFALAVVFGLASYLEPDPRGFGTHQQLRLPPCAFYTATGLKCPHCGMTTSVCLLVRGRVRESLKANPAGTVTAIGMMLAWPWCLTAVIRKQWVGTDEPGRLFLFGFTAWLLFTAAVWCLRQGW